VLKLAGRAPRIAAKSISGWPWRDDSLTQQRSFALFTKDDFDYFQSKIAVGKVTDPRCDSVLQRCGGRAPASELAGVGVKPTRHCALCGTESQANWGLVYCNTSVEVQLVVMEVCL
jgi:hypothetical protein